MHTDVGSMNPCRKTFRALHGDDGEARCLAKQWLLMGMDISAAALDGRTRHVYDIRRADIPLVPEADLDRDVEGMAA